MPTRDSWRLSTVANLGGGIFQTLPNYFTETLGYFTETLGPPSTASTRRRLVMRANCASRPAGRSP